MIKPPHLTYEELWQAYEELWQAYINERDSGIRDRIQLREEIKRLTEENAQLKKNQERLRSEFAQKEDTRRSKRNQSVMRRDLWRSAPTSIPCANREDAERLRNLMYLAVVEYRKGGRKRDIADQELLDAIDHHSLTVTDNALLIRRKGVNLDDSEAPLPDWLASAITSAVPLV